MPNSSQSKLGYARRGVLLVLALLTLGAILFSIYQWKIYNRNLLVNDANLLPFPALTQNDRILLFSPHPDDETLGAGGLMAKARNLGIPVRVVFLTNGDGSLATRLVQDAHFVEQMAKGQDPKRPKNIYQQIAPMRQAEAHAALAKLNIPTPDVTFLGYPDGGTKKMWETNWTASNAYRSTYTKVTHSPYKNSWTPNAPYCGEQVLSDLEEIIVDFKPTLVLTTSSYDSHPDHWAANAYLRAAVSQLQLQQKYSSWASRIKCYTFLIHHGIWPAPHGYHPETDLAPPAALVRLNLDWMQSPLNESEQKAKASALQQYKSQLATTPQFLRGFLRRNELFTQESLLQPPNTIQSPDQQNILDPKNDLLLPQLIPAADIKGVEVKAVSAKVLSVRLDLSAKPWRDLKYIITLHQIASGDTSVHQIIIAVDSKQKWQATIEPKAKYSLKTSVKENSITVQITARPSPKMGSYSLVSVASRLRKRQLDQTPTLLIRR